jgi:hypothetical protein
VVERPRVGDRPLYTYIVGGLLAWLTGDRVRRLGEKWRPSVGKVEECDVASQHIYDYSPYLCRLKTNGLAPASKY